MYMYKNFFDDVTNKYLVSNCYNLQWNKKQAFLTKIQRKIYVLALRGEVSRVTRLQKIIISSLNVKLLVVNSITSETRYNVSNITKVKIALLLTSRPNPDLPLFWKKLNSSISYLQFFTLYNRSIQYLIQLSFEPQWEAYLEPHIFGSRAKFIAKDAVLHLSQQIQSNYFNYAIISRFSLELKPSHQKLLCKKIHTCHILNRLLISQIQYVYLVEPNFPRRKYLNLSDLLLNILLYGLQYCLIENTLLNTFDNQKPSKDFKRTIFYINYTNTLSILCQTEKVAEWLKYLLKSFFAAISLKAEVDIVCLSDQNFEIDFLNFVLQKTNNDFNLLPNVKNKKQIIYDIRGLLYKKDFIGRRRALSHLSLEKAIRKVNPYLLYWNNYYSICTQFNNLASLDQVINNTIYRWQIKKYKRNKVSNWTKQCTKYVNSEKRISQGREILILLTKQRKNRRNHIPLISYRSSYDYDINYWRLRNT